MNRHMRLMLGTYSISYIFNLKFKFQLFLPIRLLVSLAHHSHFGRLCFFFIFYLIFFSFWFPKEEYVEFMICYAYLPACLPACMLTVDGVLLIPTDATWCVIRTFSYDNYIILYRQKERELTITQRC